MCSTGLLLPLPPPPPKWVGRGCLYLVGGGRRKRAVQVHSTRGGAIIGLKGGRGVVYPCLPKIVTFTIYWHLFYVLVVKMNQIASSLQNLGLNSTTCILMWIINTSIAPKDHNLVVKFLNFSGKITKLASIGIKGVNGDQVAVTSKKRAT